MTIGFHNVIACCLLVACSVSALELKLGKENLKVSNAHYQLTFDAKRGYALTRLGPAGKHPGIPVLGAFCCAPDGQPDKYTGAGHAKQQLISQNGQAVTCTLLRQDAASSAIRLSWNVGKEISISQEWIFDDSPSVIVHTSVAFTRRLGKALWRFTDAATPANNVSFLPDARPCSTVLDKPYRSATPHWKFLRHGKNGTGIIAVEDGGWEYFQYFTRRKSPDWSNMNRMELHAGELPHRTVPGKLELSFRLVPWISESKIRELASTTLPSLPKVEIVHAEMDKVCIKPGENNAIETTLINNSPENRKVDVTLTLDWGLGRHLSIPCGQIQFAPWESRQWRRDVPNTSDMRWGITAGVEIRENGQLTDRKNDVFSCTSFPPEAVAADIVNAGNCRQDGFEQEWADYLKRCHAGIVEYYCWAPSTWSPKSEDGLAIDKEKWEPHTESQGAYRTTLTRSFVQGFVNASHARGIRILAWITGLVNHEVMLEHPEMLQYCPDGQPSVYNGRVYGDKRFAVMKLAPYTQKAAADWGRQMADSVDRFGWDGCRWDWKFLPNVSSDPIYADGSPVVWHDWRGVPSTTLYPDQDAVGTACLSAWRKAVSERHPDFIYGTNLRADDSLSQVAPKYIAEASRNAYLQFEFLLNFGTKYPTYAKWAGELCKTVQRCRIYGGQGTVGFMKGVEEGSVSERMARHVCHAAGCKWLGGNREIRYHGSQRNSVPFAIRFAEYFYSTDFRLLPEERRKKEVMAENGDECFFRQFIYERHMKDGRQMAVHFVNARPDTYVTVFQPRPEIRRNMKVAVSPMKDERLARAFALLPGKEPACIPLQISGNMVTLPDWEEAVSLIVEFSKAGK